MPRVKKKDGSKAELRVAAVHLNEILQEYSRRDDRVLMLEGELSRLFSVYKEKVYLESIRGLVPGE